MSENNHTTGSWAQGFTLMTEQTSRWTREQLNENNARERRMIFANFSAADQGRGRKRIAICEREEDARRIVACVNSCNGVPLWILELDTPQFIRIINEREKLLAALERTVQAIIVFRNEQALGRLVKLRGTAGYGEMQTAMDEGKELIACVKGGAA